jgi:hypothetical protein
MYRAIPNSLKPIARAQSLTKTLVTYLVSLSTITAGTVIYCLALTIVINDDFHHGTLKDLHAISFHFRVRLNQMEASGNGDNAAVRKHRQNVADIDAITTAIEKNPQLPGRIFKQEIKAAVLVKVASAVLAACASALLRKNL